MKPKYIALLNKADKKRRAWSSRLRLCFQILSLADAIDADCASRLAGRGLSEGRFVVLFLLQGHPDGLPPHELAASAGVTRATITGLLDGLEKTGLIVRLRDKADRRSLSVRLTPEGERLIDMLFTRHVHWISCLFAGFTAEESALLRRLLHRVWLNTDAGKGTDAGDPELNGENDTQGR